VHLLVKKILRLYRNFGYGTVKSGMWLPTSRCMMFPSVFHFTLLLVSQTT